ncbi:MAG: PilZ domain-containing protein [Candidatus Goldbacteria bacterium]|nr:PilZ domain-containing protein [Candidatus Goldiibacteriota bacterium]
MLEIFKDRRTQKRISHSLETNYKILDNPNLSSASEYKKAQIKNISLGGLCLHSEQSLKVGNMLRVNFILEEDDKKIDTFCEVKWCKRDINGFLLGLSFITLTREEEEHIINFINQCN